MKNKLLILSLLICSLWACQSQKEESRATAVLFKKNDPALLQNSVKKLTDVIVYDIFTPPVASRIYAYTSLAAYEAIRLNKPEQYPSLTANMNGFDPMPQPDKGKNYDFTLAGIKAFMTVGQKITFSVDTLKKFEAGLLEQYAAVLDADTYKRSLELGEAIGKAVLARGTKDNYKETRGFARYTVVKGEDKWQPTAPDYADAIEPYWHTILPLALDSARQCIPPPPTTYSIDKKSDFYKEFMEVYETGKNLTEEQIEIARFWDDNPFVSHHTGHATFATKKMTPGGHWMAIATLTSRQAKADVEKTAQTYALTATSLFDGFISCWEEKFRSQFVRPVTVINQQVDETWESFLQTPPFPEYTSGHSVISASAATVLTNLYGDNFAYHDTTELEYGMGQRSFNSFMEAAHEAALSRLYGGIHYRNTNRKGTEQGIKVGNIVLSKTGLQPSTAQVIVPVSK
ncbi:vanadium-dependent haloperoxidase [Rhodocytophaga rosea]|uniref:Vanadium-dependent haloperoxidase n=1 Tax=Rhodocytophaga rosea TaxID=2704465 RepID=A0A6C0GL38_9BACT|nr:vanadium-dependent haloperoxidase [Rhodocytophaga rosea]QHT68360.1 vanadium-dependent haloperoxidase [Rhodocytophaga rosea]